MSEPNGDEEFGPPKAVPEPEGAYEEALAFWVAAMPPGEKDAERKVRMFLDSHGAEREWHYYALPPETRAAAWGCPVEEVLAEDADRARRHAEALADQMLAWEADERRECLVEEFIEAEQRRQAGQPEAPEPERPRRQRKPSPETVVKRALKRGVPVKSYTVGDVTLNIGGPEGNEGENPFDVVAAEIIKRGTVQ